MKNLSILLTILSFKMFAQPVMVYNNAHSIGVTSNLYLIEGSTTSLYQTGSSLTWDLNPNILTTAGTFDVVDPATTPFGLAFPLSNVCFKRTVNGMGTTYTYLADSMNSLTSLADEIGGTTPVIWVQFDKIAEYPFQYLDSFFAVRQSSTGAPEPYTRMYNAYGTLLINGKTYHNVIKVTKIPGHSLFFLTSPVWFPIIIEVTDNTFLYNEPLTYTALNENVAGEKDVILSPNPATEYLKVQCFKQLKSTEMLIVNSQGAIVMSACITEVETKVDVSNLPTGIYYLRLPETGRSIKFIKK